MAREIEAHSNFKLENVKYLLNMYDIQGLVLYAKSEKVLLKKLKRFK